MPCSSGTARKLGYAPVSSTSGGKPTTVPSGRAVTPGLQVQHLGHRDGDHLPAAGFEQRGELGDAGFVGAARQPHVRGPADLEHVAAIEVPGLARSARPRAEAVGQGGQRGLGGDHLAAP